MVSGGSEREPLTFVDFNRHSCASGTKAIRGLEA